MGETRASSSSSSSWGEGLIPAERWERAKELFDEALGIPTDRRAAFVAEASGGDETLRLEVQSLIASHEQAGAFLDGPAADGGDGAAARPLGRVGPYRLLGLVGRGGMGDVYRAVRDDDHFKKIVAVKLVRPDIAGELEEDRLRAERQILACLEHPGIARLLDGGSTQDGRPFLVMEYVDGTRLDAYAQAHGLDTRARVALFRTVCAAVQHAHQNLVVHRDLKPANILVTAEGVPKLLDFGVAKLLDPTLGGESTTTAFPAMTPAYASPEQVRGEPITTATDVYSLGAVLYELITGVRAHRLGGASLQAAICEQVPERPSAAHRTAHPTTGRRRFRRLAWDSDLDAIVLKALRKEPARRYPTVDAFSDDLRRYLEGLPVTAAKGTLVYRARRFVRRNRLAVGLATAVLALAGAYVVNDAMQAKRVARERDRAERVTAFLVDLFRVSDPGEARGNSVTAREMLDKGAAKIETELKEEPEARGALLETLGRVYVSLGLYAKAAALHERSLETRRQVLGPQHLDVSQSLNSLGNALFFKGDLPGAEARYREALAMRRALLGEEHVLVADSLMNVGMAVRSRTLDVAAAEALHREALAIKRRLLRPDDPSLALSLTHLAFNVRDRGDDHQAEELHREALAIRRKAFGAGVHPDIANSLNNLGTTLYRRGDYVEAERLHSECLAMKRELYGEGHHTLASTLGNLALAARARGEYRSAAALLREALSIKTAQLGAGHPWLAQYAEDLGTTLCDAGDCAAGEPLLREAVDIVRRRLGPRNPELATHLAALAHGLHAQGRLADAEAAYREALDLGRAVLPPGGPDTAVLVTGLADVLAERGAAREAVPLAREGLDIRRRQLVPGHPDVAESQSVLGASLAASGLFDEAEPLLREGHALVAARRGPRARESRDAAARAARLYEQIGQAGRTREYRALASVAAR
jgi:tetratricopeptide (TPR) repeat protein/tRNA A-37 threonylcarbamoyl transferase component Bud32